MSSQQFSPSPPPPNLNNTIMVAAIIVLFVVVFFILGLHIYAKWFWRNHGFLLPVRSVSQQAEHALPQRSSGLDKASIDSLPAFTYHEPSPLVHQQDALDCAVCLSEFQQNEQGRTLPRCNHSFHTACIDMWFSSHNTCPLCRTPVLAQLDASPAPTTIATDAEGGNADGHVHEQGTAPPLTFIVDNLPLPPPNPALYPSNVLFWGNHSQVSSAAPRPSSRSLPQISIQIPAPRSQSAASTPRVSTPLSASAHNQDRPAKAPEHNQASSSQPSRSPSLRVAIKRILSRGRGVSPSEGQHEQGSSSSFSPV